MQNHLAPPSYYAPWPSANSDTLTTVKTMQSPAYLGLFEAKEEISGPDFIDTLASFMEKNNIQPGMLNTLYNKVREFDFWFVIDDSGSMTNTSGLRKNTACENMQGQWHASNRNQNWMSRWEEVQNRLHLMTELLSCLPGIKITFSFMNRKIKYTFENKYLTPAACGAELHALINEIFTPEPDGVTPIYQTLKNVLDACKDRPTALLH